MYSKLSPQYDRLYQEHLVAFQKRLCITYPQATTYTDFYTSLGVPASEPVEFLVYGQAVGGWQKEHDYQLAVPTERVATSRVYSNATYSKDSPLDWVNRMWDKQGRVGLDDLGVKYYADFGSYSPSRSFFWQVITFLIQQKCNIKPNEWNWTEKLVWSNLYKIAPQSGSRCTNPTDADCILQRPECVGLVEQELRELKPKYCVVLTNDPWWAPFRTGLRTEPVAKPNDGVVESVELFGETTIVVTKRPRVGSYRKFVEQIMPHLN